MSDKLVVEFYQDADKVPLAAVLVLHGGDNPASSALTIAAFLMEIQLGSSLCMYDAGELAAEFILSQTKAVSDINIPLQRYASLIAPQQRYDYQLVRIYVQMGSAVVGIVRDQYSRDNEIKEAEDIFSLARIPFQIETDVVSLT